MSDEKAEYIHLNKQSEYTREQGGELKLKCPYCGAWNTPHDVTLEGCECGAKASTWMKFEQNIE